MTHESPEPPLESAEAIADRTPLMLALPRPGEMPNGIAVLAAVAEGFRAAEVQGGSLEPGESRWGPLVLRELLGSGSFGEVHRAFDPALQRDVALKLRRAEAGVLRWLDEGRALARVRHPNVVVVHGADLREGRAGLWMEQIEGRTLEQELASRGPLPVGDVLRIGLELASALQTVHAAGLTHGDIKAANVMLESRQSGAPRTVLMDFGTVRETDEGDDGLGLSGAGTPLVLAPEVLRGEPPCAKGDVYSLGVLLFRLLTAHYPVHATTMADLRLAHMTSKPLSLTAFRRDLPRALVRAIERALERDPANRTASAHEFHEALRAVAEPARLLRRRLMGAALFVTLAALLVSAGLWILRPGADMNIRHLPLPRLADPLWASETWNFEGSSVGSQFGWVATSLGDLDGDGRDEVAVTEPGYDGTFTEAGRVLVFFGSTLGLETKPRWEAQGSQAGAGFGSQIVRGGDVDGDGDAELLVAERYVRTEDGRVGAAHLFKGSAGSLASTPAWTLRDDQRLLLGLGDGLVGGFDVNADGFDDLVVSETLRSASHDKEGVLRLFLGGPGGPAADAAWMVSGGAPDAQLGWRCVSAGDVDRDGYDDLLASAPHYSGRRRDSGQVRLYRGGPGGLSLVPSWTWDGASDNALLGMTIAGGGDVNGDGFSDILLGEHGHSSGGLVMRGRILLFSGGPKGLGTRPSWQWQGPCTNSRLGYHSVLVSDLDGDGLAEVAAGATGYTTAETTQGSGLVVVFRGRRGGPAREPDWYAMGPDHAAFGALVASAGDTDGDGVSELLIGAPYSGEQGELRGRIALYRVKPAGARSASNVPR